MTNFIRCRRMIPGFIFLMILASSSLACNTFDFLVATPTATSTPTATRTLTPTLTPTATITPTRTITPTVSYLDWPVEFSDTFDDKYGGWYTGTDSDEYATLNVSITGGKYNFRITARKPVFTQLSPDLENLKDFFLAVDIQKLSGAVTADFGLIFRNRGDFFYFSINPDTRRYAIYAFDNDEWDTITQPKRFASIDANGVNRLAVLAQGSTFTLFINDEEVETFEDDMSDRGTVGLGFGLAKGGDTLNLAIDNFAVSTPKSR